MENVTDALQMAAGVLVFVLALSISINAFGEARRTSQFILDSNDKEYSYSYVEANDGTERIVGVESIIPTIYKAYKENYKIVFDGVELYSRINPEEKIFCIDLEKEVLGNDKEKEEFLEALLFGVNGNKEKYAKKNIEFPEKGLYDRIKNEKFIEQLGIYYQEEIQEGGQTPDANKTQKKVITYTKKIE